MEKTVIATNNAPAAIGPYSQAIRMGNMVFLSGQIPLHPVTGEIVQGDIRAQTRQVLENLKCVLEAAGSSPDKVVKTTIFMKDLNDYVTINAVYQEFLSNKPPARTTVQAARLPRDAGVEIEAIAFCA